MGKRLTLFASVFVVGLGILFASIMKSSSVRYVFSQSPSEIPTNVPTINYFLPGTGLIGPDDPFWSLEVVRDKVWLLLTSDSVDKSNILMLLADKRVVYSQQLSDREEFAESISVAAKAEMYLEDAYESLVSGELSSDDCRELCRELSLSALKHREILEKMYATAPDDARPKIAEVLNTPKKVYEHITHMMNELGIAPVTNPFNQ